MEMHGILVGLSGETVSETTVPTQPFSMIAFENAFRCGSNAFMSSPEGRVLEIKAQTVARTEAERLIPIIQGRLMDAASLGGFSTIVYPRVTTVSDSMFSSEVDIFRGFYHRAPNVEVPGAPTIRHEISKRMSPNLTVTNLSSNAIYVGLEPYCS